MSSTFPGTSTDATTPQAANQAASQLAKVPCETCGNTYDKAFQVVMRGKVYVFDCFECAIQTLAPICGHCGCRIIGHGVEEGGQFFCCAHCAHHEGARHVTDRA